MTVALPVLPSLEAVICVVPELTAVTCPFEPTEAMPTFALDQATTRPVRTLLFASRVVGDSWTVPPIWRVEVAGDTDTDATAIAAGALTVRAADAVLPSLDAEIDAVPGATAETSPAADTTATLVLLLPQVTVRPESGFPLRS
jgi:hypothetical protein